MQDAQKPRSRVVFPSQLTDHSKAEAMEFVLAVIRAFNVFFTVSGSITISNEIKANSEIQANDEINNGETKDIENTRNKETKDNEVRNSETKETKDIKDAKETNEGRNTTQYTFPAGTRLSTNGLPCICFYTQLHTRQINWSASFIHSKAPSRLVFYCEDFKYTVRALDPPETSCLLENIEFIVRYLWMAHDSLIPGILGFYSTPSLNFVVMENSFNPTSHRIRDIRVGSEAVERIGVDGRKEALMAVLRRDVGFLRSLGLVGYALRVGLRAGENARLCLVDFMTSEGPVVGKLCCFKRKRAAEVYAVKFMALVGLTLE